LQVKLYAPWIIVQLVSSNPSPAVPKLAFCTNWVLAVVVFTICVSTSPEVVLVIVRIYVIGVGDKVINVNLPIPGLGLLHAPAELTGQSILPVTSGNVNDCEHVEDSLV
jgi:hypothetical protein